LILPILHRLFRLRDSAVQGAAQRRKLLVNMAALYAVQGCTYLLPLATIPYLSRVLGPAGWGAVLFAQAIGAIIAMSVEYGFDFSATREVARFSNDRQRLKELITGVLSAKVALSLLGIGAALLAQPYTLRVAPSPALFWASTLWGVAQGINMLWYFQGQQRMAWAGGLDITGKIIATISIFLLVHRPEDGWKVMLAQALGCAVSHGITVIMAYFETGFARPSFRILWRSLQLGWPMFLFRASMSLSGSANGLILGFFASPAAVGMFGSADKFRQVAFQAMWPINQTLFPHQSEKVKDDPKKGLRLVRGSLLSLGVLSILFGLTLALAAPILVRIVLGAAFLPAVPILRVFGLLIPIQMLCTVLSAQWMLPLGLDRQVSLVVLTAGALNAIVGVFLSIKAGALGMAIAVTIAQLYTVFALDAVMRRQGLHPFSRLLEPPVSEPVVPGL
jgi:polysaccharide transporter, PST family